MITASGKQVFPSWSEHYTGEVPTIADIAQGLGRMVRFAGQTQRLYTVLCHTLVGAEVIDERYRINFLLHDAPEAIVSDVTSTWKSEEAAENEDELLGAIYHSIGVNGYWDQVAVAAVKRVDAACLAAEAHALGHAQAERWWPRDAWDDMTIEAYSRTIDMLQAGAPFTYLNPEAAINIYSGAIERALKAQHA